MSIDSTTRFSNRVEDYVKYRPRYPQAVIPLLQDKYGITPDKLVADIGAGTGISSALFLDAGYTVMAVEPNQEMRSKSQILLADSPRFKAINGTAEATGLAADSVDAIVVGQAFHWFDRIKAKEEFTRILKKEGKVILLWNERLTSTSFEVDYDNLILKHGRDYVQVDHRNIDEVKIQDFFTPGSVSTEMLANWQIFDFNGLKGRLLSSSYMPAYDEPGYEAMLNDLHLLFKQYERENKIRINYQTKLYVGTFRE